MSSVEALGVDRLVNSERYSLSDPEHPVWREMVSHTCAQLREQGCGVLPDFIRPELRETLRAECAAIAPLAHYDVEVVNAYNLATDRPLPEGHPGRITMERRNAFVARDQVPGDSVIHRLYTSPQFQRFVADCFDLPEIHELADPLSGLCLNVVAPGMDHPWHFDTNEFTVSMLTQEPYEGGVFEYCPNIRSATAENFNDVRSVLTGESRRLVRRRAVRPGDLQLFKGRYSLHRVNTVNGERARHSAIFAYSEQPEVIGSVERTRQLFGRVLSRHLAAADRVVRGDRLLD